MKIPFLGYRIYKKPLYLCNVNKAHIINTYIMKTLREFILDTLLPYKKDPKTCAYIVEDNNCVYKTEDGRMCAFGKHLKDVERFKDNEDNADTLLNRNGNEILTDEAQTQNLSRFQWVSIQAYHDAVARGQSCNFEYSRLKVYFPDVDLKELAPK